MEYLLVVYFLMHGVWVRGDELEGWASIPYLRARAITPPR